MATTGYLGLRFLNAHVSLRKCWSHVLFDRGVRFIRCLQRCDAILTHRIGRDNRLALRVEVLLSGFRAPQFRTHLFRIAAISQAQIEL